MNKCKFLTVCVITICHAVPWNPDMENSNDIHHGNLYQREETVKVSMSCGEIIQLHIVKKGLLNKLDMLQV